MEGLKIHRHLRVQGSGIAEEVYAGSSFVDGYSPFLQDIPR